MSLPLILDTDIGTDVDDALALAFALRHRDLDLRAVTTVSGDTRRRALIAAKLLRAAERDDVEVASGLGAAEGYPGGMGHEGLGLLEDDEELPLARRSAVDLLVEELCAGAAEESMLRVATVGTQSNLAAAVRRAPAVSARIPLVAVMGGVFAPIRFAGAVIPPSSDVNLNHDPESSLAVLNAGIETLYVPLDVTRELFLGPRHLERLRRGDALCRALARLVDVWAPILRRLTRGAAGDAVAVLHDPLAVACLVERSLVASERLPVTVALHRGTVRTFIDPVEGHEAEVVTSVDESAFADLWLDTVLG